MMIPRLTTPLRVALPLLVVLLAGGACTYGHQEAQSGVFQPLVFPGEARLGASAFMVIDTNQMVIGDHLERYDLHWNRVRILVEGNLATVPANLRSVFTVESGRSTIDAEVRRNSWMTVAFFDLPDDTSSAFTPPYPQHARLHLEVDGQIVPDLEGVIWVIGEGGEPTSLDASPLLPLLEVALEPKTMIRLRAASDGAKGFQPTWTIAGISTEIRYDSNCLQNPSAHTGSEAVGGGLTIGPSVAEASPTQNFRRAQLVFSHPRGFPLLIASSIDPSRLGTGPILDVTFDRVQSPGCSGPLSSYFSIRSLKVHDRNGTLRASRPAPSETSFDGSEFFHFYYVDPDQPS